MAGDGVPLQAVEVTSHAMAVSHLNQGWQGWQGWRGPSTPCDDLVATIGKGACVTVVDHDGNAAAEPLVTGRDAGLAVAPTPARPPPPGLMSPGRTLLSRGSRYCGCHCPGGVYVTPRLEASSTSSAVNRTVILPVMAPELAVASDAAAPPRGREVRQSPIRRPHQTQSTCTRWSRRDSE